MRRFATSLATSIFLLAVAAPAALAQNSGEGAYGETDDKVVTYAGFVLIVFFPILVLVLSLVQSRLEKRKKDRMRSAQAAGGEDRWKQGW